MTYDESIKIMQWEMSAIYVVISSAAIQSKYDLSNERERLAALQKELDHYRKTLTPKLVLSSEPTKT